LSAPTRITERDHWQRYGRDRLTFKGTRAGKRSDNAYLVEKAVGTPAAFFVVGEEAGQAEVEARFDLLGSKLRGNPTDRATFARLKLSPSEGMSL
jgi:hypothetical protein